VPGTFGSAWHLNPPSTPNRMSFPQVVSGNPGFHTMDKQFYVYILASERNGTLYTGVTADLVGRTWQHREGGLEGFTKKYSVKRLVYYEVYGDAENAITREKRIKKWRREWKIELIEKVNPGWKDLYKEICQLNYSP
jgi:putative endonuclease